MARPPGPESAEPRKPENREPERRAMEDERPVRPVPQAAGDGDPDPEDVREALEAAVEAAEAAGAGEAIRAGEADGAEHLTAITTIADETPPAVLAEAIADLDSDELRTVIAALGSERSADVMAELD